MKKTLILLGASIAVFATLSSGAEARKVRYEINGKQYSYSTNNRAQTEEAKKRIEAAQAAEAAKARADAERSSNPIKAAFGSDSQREAAEAQEKLQRLLSERSQGTASAPSSPEPREVRRTNRREAVREASLTQMPRQFAPAGPNPAPALRPAAVAAPAVAEPVTVRNQAKLRSISFDVETGIKTTIMADGTMTEEPFDSSALAALMHGDEEKSSLMAFVKRLRKTAPEEATGSIRTSVAEPEPEPGNWHH